MHHQFIESIYSLKITFALPQSYDLLCVACKSFLNYDDEYPKVKGLSICYLQTKYLYNLCKKHSKSCDRGYDF